MSSSTSSSEAPTARPGTEWRVVAFVLGCLLVAECGMRLVETRLSLDVKHLRSLPDIADSLRAHDGHKVLLMGNSLTRCAIAQEEVRSGLEASGLKNPGLFFFTADATNIVNWDYGFRRYFDHAGALPDEVLIGTGPWHLDDSPGDATRLGAFYVATEEIPAVWQSGQFKNMEEKGEFLFSRFSVLYANRERVRPRVFGTLIPHYFEMEQWMNDQRVFAQNQGARGPAVGLGKKATHHHLDALLTLLQQKNVKAHLFTVSLPEPYDLPPEVYEIAAKRGAHVHHLAGAPAVQASSFSDGYHLTETAAAAYSARLVESLKISAGRRTTATSAAEGASTPATGTPQVQR